MQMDANVQQSMDHAWRYFELHAQQRMSVFNFYLAISGAVAAGGGVCLQQGGKFVFVASILGVFLSSISFIFWKLDQRVSAMIKRSEIALSALEKASCIKHATLFVDDSLEQHKIPYGFLSTWTYGRCFRVSFSTVGLAGLIFAIVPFLVDFPAK
jgi:hypothetical protein